MLQSKNCIRTGQVLLDENLHSFLLCNSCHMDFRNYSEFCKHLEKCEGVERIFHDNLMLKYDTKNCEQIKRNTGKIIKQYFIYNIADVELLQKVSTPSSQALQKSTPTKYLNVMKIEEELLNPCWYINDDNDDIRVNKIKTSHVTASKKNIQYDKLVEAVTPFVQFKENAKTLNNSNNNTAKKNSSLLKTIKTNNTAGNINTTDRTNDVLPTRDKSKLLNKRRLYITLNSNENTQANSNNSKDPMITTNCTKKQSSKPITVVTTSNVTHLKRQLPPPHPQLQPQQQQQSLETQPPYPAYSTEAPQAKRPRLVDATALSLKIANNATTTVLKNTTPQIVNTVNKSANRLLNSMVINLNTSSSSSSSSSSSLLSLSSSSTAANLPLNNVKPATANTGPLVTDKAAIIPNTKEKQTAQILNKLQTLGLQIKRTKPLDLLTPPVSEFSGKTDRKTLEFLNKLQSKGTKVTILKPSTSSKSSNNQLHPISTPPIIQASNHKTYAILKLANVTTATTTVPAVSTTTTTTTTTTRESLVLPTTKTCETKCKLPLSKNIIVKKIK